LIFIILKFLNFTQFLILFLGAKTLDITSSSITTLSTRFGWYGEICLLCV